MPGQGDGMSDFRCDVCEAPLHEGECMNCAYGDARDELTRLRALNEELVEALEAAYAFIADEYADAASQALDGEHVSPEARAVWKSICDALAKAKGGGL